MDAIKAIRHQVCKILIDVNAFSGSDVKSFLVQTPTIALRGKQVKLEDRGPDKNPEYQVPVLASAPSGAVKSTSVYSGNSERARSNETRIRVAVKNVLPKLQYLRGQLRMRANFGSFRLKGYRKPVDSYKGTVDEFRSILTDQNTDGILAPL